MNKKILIFKSLEVAKRDDVIRISGKDITPKRDYPSDIPRIPA